MSNNIWDYWVSKLLIPKVVIINEPGIIISKTSSRYSNKESSRRIIFYFEDILSGLQRKTIEKLGKNKSADLWYKIGKDTAIRYMLLSKIQKIPQFLLSSVINHMFAKFKGGGTSVAKKIHFDNKNKSLIMVGKENIYCRKSMEGNLFAGSVSGFLSYLTGKNIEAETKCYKCPLYCKIVANKKIPFKYKPNIQELIPLEKYEQFNFIQNIKSIKKEISFSDLLKFKKIWIDNSEKFCFQNKTIVPIEIGAYGILVKKYLEINQEDFLRKTILKESENFACHFLKNKEKDKLYLIKNILCSLGWGILNYKKEKHKIIFNIINPPITKYNFIYESIVLNGFINEALNKKFKMENLNQNNNFSLITITYLEE